MPLPSDVIDANADDFTSCLAGASIHTLQKKKEIKYSTSSSANTPASHYCKYTFETFIHRTWRRQHFLHASYKAVFNADVQNETHVIVMSGFQLPVFN